MRARHAATMAALALATFLFMTAAQAQDRDAGFTFIVTGNTYPESPFIGFTETIPLLVSRITEENPLFVVHTGNMIQGGSERVGIIEKDITRQFALFTASFKDLPVPLYTLAGERDLHNASAGLYENRLKRELCYSCTISGVHMVFLNTLIDENSPANLKNTLAWLKNDLKSARGGRVIVFTHYCPFARKGTDRFTWSGPVHGLLKGHPVSAVISGSEPAYYTLEKDGVRYINTGCGGFNKEDRCYRCSQYYRASFSENGIDVSPVSIPLR